MKSATLIDHIHTNNVLNDVLPGIILSDTSEHLPVFIKINFSTQETKIRRQKIRDFKNINETTYVMNLQNSFQNLVLERKIQTQI